MNCKKVFLTFLLLAGSCLAQNFTSITGTSIQNASGTVLATGQICFFGTDASDNPISYQAGGGGQVIKREVCTVVLAGIVGGGFQVANPANTVPAGVLYRIRVIDTSTGQEVLRYKTVSFSGAAFNFDTYAPNPGTVVPPNGASILGPLTVTGNVTVTGSCTGCGSGINWSSLASGTNSTMNSVITTGGSISLTGTGSNMASVFKGPEGSAGSFAIGFTNATGVGIFATHTAGFNDSLSIYSGSGTNTMLFKFGNASTPGTFTTLTTLTSSGSSLIAQPIWNNGAVVFPGALLVNVNDTASAAGSLLADFQDTNVSKVSITKAGLINYVTASGGAITATGSNVIGGVTLNGGNITGLGTINGGGAITLGGVALSGGAITAAGSLTGVTTISSGAITATGSNSIGSVTLNAGAITNATFDTAAAGNVFKINGTSISDTTGGGKVVLQGSPTINSPSINSPTISTGNLVMNAGVKITSYNGIATLGNGVGSIVAVADLTSQGAAITTTTIYTTPGGGAGQYEICFNSKVTRAATSSSTLGGAGGFQIIYTDQDDSVVVTTPNLFLALFSTNANTTQTYGANCALYNVKASTAIQYLMGYSSTGGTTMQYNLHIQVIQH